MKRFAVLLIVLALCFAVSPAAFAIDVIGDAPWDDEENQTPDNGLYFAHAPDKEYVVLWVTPECNIDDGYLIVPDGTQMIVKCRVSYMEGTPWGKVTVPSGVDDDGNKLYFDGWVLMSELRDINGEPAYVEPEVVPEPSLLPDPTVTDNPEPTPAPSDAPEEPTESLVPQRPSQAITVTDTYNDAIVYTCIAITIGALALVAYVFIKHKALNKKGE